MTIEDLTDDDEAAIEQAAALLVDFAPNRAAAWPDLEAAYEAIEEALEAEGVVKVARNDDGDVIGYVAVSPQYPHAWELHPIVVAADAQGLGVGRALLTSAEKQVAANDGRTVYLGADDLDGLTTVADTDLFPGVLGHALEAKPQSRRHPLGFFLHLGYEVVGLIPDANGEGRPDIWMAKPVAGLAEDTDEDEDVVEDEITDESGDGELGDEEEEKAGTGGNERGDRR